MFSYSSVIPWWVLIHCEAVYVRKINLLPAKLSRDMSWDNIVPLPFMSRPGTDFVDGFKI